MFILYGWTLIITYEKSHATLCSEDRHFRNLVITKKLIATILID